ncbi:DUF1761 domain-containing protein [Fictibacillus sp. KIGAM418]|uniref:DUF1761 domain-containing protein n=1 Tax=Fictibacillus marinisediminis TaxID=2878389 RepID=A0A9X1X7Q8_9BACL|nr:DUF1761 domain-containing protein [Fictibacillus marinisediminis]MCK6255484.1 DUF1761 domain-containing protein [Fictibacillus marinisediminis]
MDLSSLNYLPIIVGGIVYMLYGGIYYSIVLSEKKKSTHKEFAANESKGPGNYIYSVITAFIISFFMAVLVQSIGADTLGTGLGMGFIIGLLITLVYLKNSLFGLMSRKSFFIAIGDHLVIFTVLGAIHGFLN